MTGAALVLELKRGGRAYILEHSEDFVSLASTAPSPPGSTLEAHYASAGKSTSLRIKVRSCRRDQLPDGTAGFRIDGRFVSLTRADREALSGSQPETDPASTSET